MKKKERPRDEINHPLMYQNDCIKLYIQNNPEVNYNTVAALHFTTAEHINRLMNQKKGENFSKLSDIIPIKTDGELYAYMLLYRQRLVEYYELRSQTAKNLKIFEEINRVNNLIQQIEARIL